MDDLTYDEELELDYEAEDNLRRPITDAVADDTTTTVAIAATLDKADDVQDAPTDNTASQKSLKRRHDSPERWERGTFNEHQEIEPADNKLAKLRAAKRTGRADPDLQREDLLPMAFFPDELNFEDDFDEAVDNHPPLTKNQVSELVETLGVDFTKDSQPLNTVFLRGFRVNTTHYDVEKIFADYYVNFVLKVTDQSFIVQLGTSRLAAKLLCHMTRPILRTRRPRQVEEGEVMDWDHEVPGQVIQKPGGEEVLILEEPKKTVFVREDGRAEVNIDIAKIPIGQWRIVTQHVPLNVRIYARYATLDDLKAAKANTDNTEYRVHRVNARNSNSRHIRRAGINVFDTEGKELPWNFEHDTRIFATDADEPAKKKKPNNTEEPSSICVEGAVIPSRGRGARRILHLESSSESESASDKEEDKDFWNDDDMDDEPGESVIEKTKASDDFLNSVLGSP